MALSPEQEERNQLIKDRVKELRQLHSGNRAVLKDLFTQATEPKDLTDLVAEQVEKVENDDEIKGSFE